MKCKIDFLNKSLDDFTVEVLQFLVETEDRKEQISFLGYCLSETMMKNRLDLSRFIISQLEIIRKDTQYNGIERQLTAKAYTSKFFDQKVSYWSGRLHGLMRNQVESCLDEYAIFTIEWYENVKMYEPKFDNIMDTVFAEKWKNYWDKNEYLKRIGK